MPLFDDKIRYFFAALDCELYNGVPPDKALRRTVESYASVFREDLRPLPGKPVPRIVPDPWIRGRETELRPLPIGLLFFMVTAALSAVTLIVLALVGALQ